MLAITLYAGTASAAPTPTPSGAATSAKPATAESAAKPAATAPNSAAPAASSRAIAVEGAIAQRWDALGAEGGPLGAPIRPILCGLRNGGCMQHFERGMIYWSPATGAQQVWGAISSRYASLRWEFGPLGYPLHPEFCGLRDGGCVQEFQGGLLYWSPGSGVQPVWGAIRGEYARMRWENSPLGYPTTPEFCGLRDGGCGQHYQGGSIYWSPGSGAHTVRGALREAWSRQGWERGALRYPTTAEGPAEGTLISQYFQGGKLVYHTDTRTVDSGRPPEFCQATWYGVGTWTASGEPFNPSLLTAAHKTLPMPSYARVTNLANGRSVTVRINDRGPFAPGRCIDLSTAAFQAIGDTRQGVVNVRVDPL